MTFQSHTFVPVYRTAEIRDIEAAALGQPDPAPLMEHAGLAAAQIARDIAADRGRGVIVLAGPGNNGGDAFVVARYLKSWWFRVDVVFTGNPTRLSADAQAAYAAWHDGGGATLDRIPADRHWDLAIDGLFGIGLQRELSGNHAALVTALNALNTTVLALDVPSGLDADTGRVLGCAVRAGHTATFIGLKPGLLTLDGPDHCGEIHVCTLDLDAPPARGAVIGNDVIRSVLPARRANSHKGDFGSVGIIGGAPGMTGAALLAGRAALQLGTGRVYVGLLAGNGPGYDPAQPELMLRAAHEILQLDHLNCLAVGPGLGQSPDAHHVLSAALQKSVSLVLDADALNVIAADPNLQQIMLKRTPATILTPHPAEAARLLGGTTASIQTDRISAACEIAARYRAWAVLKGAGSICALPDGTWFINTSGNPGMASAGMGDVLTGIIAAMLAQGADAKQALLAGVHLHGAAGDALAAGAHGPIGMTATDVVTAARTLFNRERLPRT
jgi:ADP-dependent NAD(P)H-hydrate dehydratase / NAD(P)H-hydrate epimerase